MIVDTLANAGRYRTVLARLQSGFDYLESFDPATPDGRYEIDGDRVFAMVQSYETAPSTEKRFETHRRNLDIQYIVSGRERLLHLDREGLEPSTQYDEKKDVIFYHDPAASSSILLGPGEFAVFFPSDAHKGGCMAGGRDAVRKVVIKVQVDS